MEKQYNSLIEKEAWVVEDLPPGEKVLPSNWVFDEKDLPMTDKKEARARWVVCGNHEDGDWETGELYAAVVHSTSVKAFLAIVATQDLECQQYDIKVAFLNARPEGKPVYVEQPHGFVKVSSKVCRVLRAFYGLRRSPLWWFRTITPLMEELGFVPFDVDLCLFKNEETGALVILYVDDILVAASAMAEVHLIRDGIAKHFELKDLGEAKKFLGFMIHRDRSNHRIYLTQEDYVEAMEAMLKRFDWQSASTGKISTPWPHRGRTDSIYPRCGRRTTSPLT